MITRAYGKRLHKAALQEFIHFWSLYRYWAVVATAFVAPVLFQVFRHGVHSMTNLRETLESGLIGLVLSMLGTYAIAIRSGVENLDLDLQSKISIRDGEISRLNDLLKSDVEFDLTADPNDLRPTAAIIRNMESGAKIPAFTISVFNVGPTPVSVVDFRITYGMSDNVFKHHSSVLPGSPPLHIDVSREILSAFGFSPLDFRKHLSKHVAGISIRYESLGTIIETPVKEFELTFAQIGTLRQVSVDVARAFR